MKYQTLNNRFPAISVVISSSSRTVPDMSFTPREILSKFSRGEKVPLGFEGLYDDEKSSEFDENPTRDPNFDNFDYVEESLALKERQNERQKRSKDKPGVDSKRKASGEELSESDAMSRETTSGEASPGGPASS